MAARKMLVMGDPGVGKSSLVRRLVHGRFEQDYINTLGVDISTYLVQIPEDLRGQNDGASELRLMIWDLAGEFGMDIFRMPYFAGTSAALIVSDCTLASTQQSMVALAEAFDAACPGRPYTLVLNKSDLATEAVGADWRSRLPARLRLVTTSAKTGENVAAAFHDTAVDLVRHGI